MNNILILSQGFGFHWWDYTVEKRRETTKVLTGSTESSFRSHGSRETFRLDIHPIRNTGSTKVISIQTPCSCIWRDTILCSQTFKQAVLFFIISLFYILSCILYEYALESHQLSQVRPTVNSFNLHNRNVHYFC